MFDPWTLWAVLTVVAAMLAAAMFFVWWLTPAEPALLQWVLSLALFVLGILAGLWRDELPFFVGVGLGNAAFLFGYGLFWRGLRSFDDRPLPIWAIGVAPALWLGLIALPPFATSIDHRVALISVMIAGLIVLCLEQLWQDGLDRSRARLSLFVALSISLVMNLLRVPLLSGSFAGEELVLLSSPAMLGFGLLGLALTIFMCFAVVLMVRERAEVQYRRAAGHDELTGLLNRRGFMQEATAAAAAGGPLALMFIDLDHFKQINDQFGHAAGDSVLVLVAQVLRGSLRTGDVIGRVGGEEFVVLLPGASAETGRLAAERIQRGLESAAISLRPDIESEPVHCTASIGLALAVLPAAGSAPVLEGRLLTLMDRADAVLYQAKNDGRNRIATVHVEPGRA